jgi:AhpC/TSA family
MTMITILNEQRETRVSQAQASADSLWMSGAAIKAATGWTWKPEGLCQDDTCVPIPHAMISPDREGMLDIAEIWRHMGHPVAHDMEAKTWVLGTGSARRIDSLSSLDAPDFELPELAGRKHRLSDYRGKKVLLATWASW